MLKHVCKYVAAVAILVCAGVGQAWGQTGYQESQSRAIEPKQDVYIKPLVAEIEVLEGQKRQDYGPYTYPIKSVETLTLQDLVDMKAWAVYRAAREADADIIVAATFNLYTDEKGKNMIIELSGFPGKYINFRTASKEDGDYEWITTVYPYMDRVNTMGKTKAVEN